MSVLFVRNIANFSKSYMDDADGKEKKRKTQRIPKITLIHTDKSISVISLEDAEKLAKRRNLGLIHVSNASKSGRSVYELENSSKIDKITSDVAETHKNEQKTKSVKLFTIKQNIKDYDLNVKINNINKTLKRNYKAKIFFSHPKGLQEEVIEEMKQKIQGIISGTQKRKDSTILVYTPLLTDENISSKEDVNDK
ncbi:uncharacterized protein LOC117239479 isoform X2 [Bombus vosnesenskii]|uniref:Uncharacterized protein LOC117239479 isoform X2 n=1 Tax=Bombus vosnesenskii TaxID=207650 RepID=A0A6J3L6S4_9HYME|nr:uncharacterized protein LOC117239479 isoform X2 [Bombus vosnesenskii]XP_033360948.1 uncharacterized protein LOC117239479 isoform X2 [Bombus vosnesenskii]XP_033360949.1 uncharacterized protein LOC117239479 isoform X2 [Bombus vosnesenskii]XP_033360950.1 uncharacterized protein LOC117239479 isoform X2 [Bombus vosnesenskii]